MQTEGIKLLQGTPSSHTLRRIGPLTLACAEIYSASPSHRRECSYYIAVGYYKLKNYANAKKFNGECLVAALPELSSKERPC